jgi:hypothetical protein
MNTYTCTTCGKDRITPTCNECAELTQENMKTITLETEQEGKATNVYIADTVRVNINTLDNGQILYQLESYLSIVGRWIPCGKCVEYTNVPAI